MGHYRRTSNLAGVCPWKDKNLYPAKWDAAQMLAVMDREHSEHVRDQ